MKGFIPALLFVLFLLLFSPLHAQNVNCSSFCVTGMYMDTTPNWMWVTIEFHGEDDDYINYPHIPAILNEQGDTVATGTLWFFGQIGNSTADYPVTTVWDSIPNGFIGTVIFNYDTVSCALPVPCTLSSVKPEPLDHKITISPNPVSTDAIITSDQPFSDLTVQIFNEHGQQMLTLKHGTGTSFEINLEALLNGTYVLQLKDGNQVIAVKKIVILH